MKTAIHPMKLKCKLLFLPILSFACGMASGQDAGMFAEPFVRGDTAVFRFAPKKRMFWADYKGNAAAIDLLTRSIRQHRLLIESGDMKVRVLGFCSSYNSRKENLAAAKNRSNQVKSYFIVHEGLKEDHFRTTNSTQRWRGMTDVTAVTYMLPSAKADTVPDTLSERDVVPSGSLPENEKSESRPESRTPESPAEPDTPDEKTSVGRNRSPGFRKERSPIPYVPPTAGRSKPT